MRKWLSGIAVLAALAGCATDGQPEAAPPELPHQTLLSSSMREEPVPGWTVTVAELGLPPGTVVRPIGNIGSRGIFLGITDEGWWLVGIDVTNGHRLLGPVRLGAAGDASNFNCFVNGPPMVLCVRQAADVAVPATAWVVDTNSGTMVFDGLTDVRIAAEDGQPVLEQIGDHAVATVAGKGIHGVGPRGELTWFVPGDGILAAQFASWDRDSLPSTLAVQKGGDLADVVFSVADGQVVKPELPQDVRLWRAMVFPGGFGYEYEAGDGQDRVAFFDQTGALLSEIGQKGSFETRSADLPTIVMQTNDRVMTLDGRTLVELPPTVPAVEARLIGSRLFVANDPKHEEWQQFDLRTGETGKTCETDSLGFYYIASDGEVAVALGERTPARAVDLTTCETIWSIAGSGPGEAKEVWRVNTTLVQRTDDRLFSLVAPG
jgi:hypothetical protein